jgi:RNA polymerase sigma factor (sigma-70 family)
MAASRINEVVEYLRKTVLLHDGAGLSDGQLLGFFLEQGDQAALAALVRRHGPLVWSICRRILVDHHDAEDAFQATFLVLVRRAASVVPREMVANWLYGVAVQTARKAKATAVKRRTRETQMEQLPEPAVPDPDRGNDLYHLLHQALGGLPDKFRVSIILCYLEGKTRMEAARQLGVPEGTLAAWLARGRAMLAKRLARQGLVMSASALTVALVQSTASASVPVSLASSTMHAASLLATGQAVSAVVSTRVVALMEGVMKGMWATKLKLTTTVLLALVAAAGLGSGALAYRMQAEESEIAAEMIQPLEQQPSAGNEAPPEQAEFAARRDDSDKDTLIGSGKEGKKEIKVADFDALDIHLPMQVRVKQGKAFSVVIIGDDNLLEIPRIDKDGNTLKISATKRSWRTKQTLTAQITMPALQKVHLNSASRMTIEDFKSIKDFNAAITGASKLDGAIEAKNVKLDASGASKVTLKTSGDINATITGASNLDGSIESQNVKLNASAASKVKLKGSAKKGILSASGACHLELGDLALETANVKLTGASHAAIQVKTKLDYSLSGASKLRYQGNPTIGQAHSTGASSLRRGLK